MDMVSEEERRKVAQDVICLLNVLDDCHVKSYLGKDIPGYESAVSTWMRRITSVGEGVSVSEENRQNVTTPT